MAKKARKRANGEGSLRERADGTWEATITIGRDREGNLIRKSFYGKTQTIAKEKRDQFLTEVRTGTYVEPSKLTVGQLVGDWLKVFAKPHMKRTTYAKYDSAYRTHIVPGLGHVLLQKLSTIKVQEFYNSLKRSSSTISIVHIVLNKSLEYAVEEGLIKKNHAKKTTRPAVKYKEVVPMTEKELDRYFEAAGGHRMFAAFFTDLTTGLRRGELMALKWKKVDLDKGSVKITESLNRVQIELGKTELMFTDTKNENADRIVPLLPDTVKVLKTHKSKQAQEKLYLGEAYEDNDLVFCTGNGKPYEPRNLLRLHKSILTMAGLRNDITIHNLRHTFTTLVLKKMRQNKNVDLLALLKILGHADERMILRTYGHSDDEDLRNVIETLKDVIKA